MLEEEEVGALEEVGVVGEELVEEHVEEDLLEVEEEVEEEEAVEDPGLNMEVVQDTHPTAKISRPHCAPLDQARLAIQDHSNAAVRQPRECASQFLGGCLSKLM